ncbi:hypothetical protein [Halorubrum sp. F4]|uniref:hypothetical protein n=1 Tax=Halorubrum sp. F4 TaxID=2989715 RepID=UPI0024813032|nr:hypothetical protein [Halorubrum sp. F4]
MSRYVGDDVLVGSLGNLVEDCVVERFISGLSTCASECFRDVVGERWEIAASVVVFVQCGLQQELEGCLFTEQFAGIGDGTIKSVEAEPLGDGFRERLREQVMRRPYDLFGGGFEGFSDSVHVDGAAAGRGRFADGVRS